MRYELHTGRIQTWALEAHVVDQCNLRCAQCCSLSPHLPPRFTQVERLAADLSLAARVLRPQLFKLSGGEPFLHPALGELLEVARASEISSRISVTTNGFLAASAPDALFERLDAMTLSLYSSAPLPLSTLDRLRRRCAEHDITLNEKAVESFQDITPERSHASIDQARAAHASCWMKIRCHLVHEGRFFTCTRPPHLDAWLASREHTEADGVALEGADLLARLLEYLERDEPLRACARCLGNAGARRPHAQLDAAGRGTG